jgi:hypothetical protein
MVTIVKLTLKSVMFSFDASRLQFPARTYCGSCVLLLVMVRREDLIVPMALKFPVGFVRKRTGAGSVSFVPIVVVVVVLLPAYA